MKLKIDQLVMAKSVHLYGHVLRRALGFEVEGQRKRGRRKGAWKKQVEENFMKVSLSWEGAPWRSKWIAGVNQIAIGSR